MKTRKTFQLFIMALMSVSFLFSNYASAQTLDSYGELKRPANMGDSEYDSFKNSSFDVYFNTCKLDANLKKIEGNLVGYQQDKDNIDFKSLRSDIKALREINEAIPDLKNELKGLKGKSENLAKNAKNVKPKMKAPKAVKNTKKSIEALDKAKEKMGSLVDRQAAALKLATELLGDN
jgi:prefoldin subunit 5